MRKRILYTLFFSLLFSFTYAQSPKHSRVKIWTGDGGMRKLSSLGLETDHGDYRKNVWFISDFSVDEIQSIDDAGFQYEILIDDVINHYQNQAHESHQSHRIHMSGHCEGGAPEYPVPANFSLGSYAGYFTYQEMLNNLDSMAAKYPNIISIRQPLPGGNTIENRPIYFVKISDNVNIDENEPEVLYTALHHAREPGSMSQLIYYMWYLLENYATDTEIAAIVDNTEMFFVPCLNPDGYIYNEVTEPLGGGLWRKNRRDNLDGTFGVDLNRNYGYNWGYDDDGSSPNPNSAVYRGTAPFSEPETQLLRDFIHSRQFLLAFNYHTFGNLLIYPWGYEYSIYTPDSALYSNYGNLLTKHNGYTYGTADQTVGYIVNGNSDDWMYGEQSTKPKIFAMTPECGDAAFGFWPADFEIIPLCQANMFQNITLALLAGKYARVEETSPPLVSIGGGYINFTTTQLGLDTTGTYTITLSPLTPNIFQVGNPVTITGLGVLQEVNDSISFALTSPMTNGEPIRFLLSIDNGVYVRNDTITKYFGQPSIAFASDGNSTAGWNAGQWGISTSIFYSPSGSITDSPNGDYGPNQFKAIRLTNAVNLANTVKAMLSFYARWAIEPNYDYVQVQASTNNGITWEPLCGKYTVPGSLYQDLDEPVYEGFQFGWVREEISLDDYLGQNLIIRFVLSSDIFVEFDGFYFDDVLITKVLPGTNSLENLPASAHISSITPNPAGDYTFVNFSNGIKNGAVAIYDAIGKKVMYEMITPGVSSMRIETSNLQNGVYIVRVENGNINSTPVKLVISH